MVVLYLGKIFVGDQYFLNKYKYVHYKTQENKQFLLLDSSKSIQFKEAFTL